MSIETDLAKLLRDAGVQAFLQSVPQDVARPFTVIRTADSEPLMTLDGYAGITRTDFVFDSWADSATDAISQRNAVLAAIRGSNLNQSQLPSGDNAFDDRAAEYLEACAFSIWHP